MLPPFLDLQLRKGVSKEETASYLGKLLFNKKNPTTQKPHQNQKEKKKGKQSNITNQKLNSNVSQT